MTAKESKETSRRRPSLTVSVDGPRVGKARLSASDLAEIIRRTQQALKRIGQVLYGESSTGRGRKKREIEELCELFLIEWRAGSAVAQLELGEPPAQLQLFGNIGEESLEAFVNGISTIARGESPPAKLPAGFDTGVLQTWDALGKVLDHGVESIRFDGRNEDLLSPTTFDRPVRERVRELLGQPADVSSAAKTGRLEELNGHRVLTGRLWEADGTEWLCFFEPRHLEQLADAWMRTVKLVGKTAVVERGGERTLNVDSLLILEDETTDRTEPVATIPFWTSLSLDELAEQQGVSPVTDLDEISNLWPADDDPEEFLAHVLAERAARRRIAGHGDGP